jgi:hypothetical protein
MVWTALDKFTFLTELKDLTVKLAVVICRKLDLGQPTDGYLDMLYLACNLTFVMDEGTTDYEDDDYDYLYALYTKTLKYHNRYKGI